MKPTTTWPIGAPPHYPVPCALAQEEVESLHGARREAEENLQQALQRAESAEKHLRQKEARFRELEGKLVALESVHAALAHEVSMLRGAQKEEARRYLERLERVADGLRAISESTMGAVQSVVELEEKFASW